MFVVKLVLDGPASSAWPSRHPSRYCGRRAVCRDRSDRGSRVAGFSSRLRASAQVRLNGRRDCSPCLPGLDRIDLFGRFRRLDARLHRGGRTRDRAGLRLCCRSTGHSRALDQLLAEFFCHFPTVGPGALAQKFPVQGSPDPLGDSCSGARSCRWRFCIRDGGGYRRSGIGSPRLQRDCALFAEVEQNFRGDCYSDCTVLP